VPFQARSQSRYSGREVPLSLDIISSEKPGLPDTAGDTLSLPSDCLPRTTAKTLRVKKHTRLPKTKALVLNVRIEKERPNGLAQRQRRDWRDSTTIIAHFWQADAVWSGRAAVRLEPVLGVFLLIVI
jgi:hypothetical protein